MVVTELGRFGDKRLACVGGALLAAMQRKRTLCVHRLAKDRNQAIQFGRFLINPAVTPTRCWLPPAGRPTVAPKDAMFWRSWIRPTCCSPHRRPTSTASVWEAIGLFRIGTIDQ
jgi:hypothetical protein